MKKKNKSVGLKPESCIQILANQLDLSQSVNYSILGSLSFHFYKMEITILNGHSIWGKLNEIIYIQHLVSTWHLKMSIFFPTASFLYFPLLFLLIRFKPSPKLLFVLFPKGFLKCQVRSKFLEVCIIFVKEPWKHICLAK